MHPPIQLRRALTALSVTSFILGCASAPPPEPSHGSIRATGPSSPLEASPAAEIQMYLDSVYDRHQPGAAVLVIRDGRTIVREAHGMADLELGVPLRPEHVFGIGSITKQFTAVAVLMLAEEGKLSLDDDITRFIPDYPTHGHRITIEDLLHHTSGIRSYTAMPEFQEMMRVDLTLDSLIAVFQHEPLDFAPRENWIYSNSGYVLLGKIIEEASGQAYADFLREHVFEPSGLESTYYGSARRIIPGRVSGYERVRDGWRNAEYVSMTVPHAAGALLSTVDDLARWQDALDHGELVDPELLRRAQTSGVLTDGRATGYGYGWLIGRAFGRESIEHGGGIEGFRAYLLNIPSENLVLAVLTNREEAEPSPQEVGLHIAGLTLGATEEPDVIALPPESLREYVGVYRVNDWERRQISYKEGRLYSQRTGQEKFEITPLDQDLFLYPETNTLAEFERDESGAIVRMRMRPRVGMESLAPRTDETALRPQAINLPTSLLERYTGEYRFSENAVLAIRLAEGELRANLTGLPEVTLEAESETRFRAVGPAAWAEFEGNAEGKAESVVVFMDGRETRAPRIR